MYNEELIQAAELLKTNCEKCNLNEKSICTDKNGRRCDFYNGIGTCRLQNLDKPKNWNVCCYFSDEEIALAKALKALGVTTVTKGLNGVHFQNDSFCVATVTSGYFYEINCGDSILIDDIIQAGENPPKCN